MSLSDRLYALAERVGSVIRSLDATVTQHGEQITALGTPSFVGPTQPVMSTPGVWYQTNPDGSLKTIWIGTTT